MRVVRCQHPIYPYESFPQSNSLRNCRHAWRQQSRQPSGLAAHPRFGYLRGVFGHRDAAPPGSGEADRDNHSRGDLSHPDLGAHRHSALTA